MGESFGVKVLRAAFRRFLILSCALYLGGAHWMLLQMTAWTGMIIVRSQDAPVAVAVESTFDGDHPCRLCAAINEAKKEEQKRDQDRPVVKKAQDYKFVMSGRCELPPAECRGAVAWLDSISVLEQRESAPPTPPPRA